MIFCLPHEVCDCLSKSTASIAFTSRFNFLFSDVIKGWFRTGEQGLPNQWADVSLIHSVPCHDAVSDFQAIPLDPQNCLYSPICTTVSLCHTVLSPDLSGRTLCLRIRTLTLLWWKQTFLIFTTWHWGLEGRENVRKKILPCFKDIQKLQNFWKLDQSESS